MISINSIKLEHMLDSIHHMKLKLLYNHVFWHAIYIHNFVMIIATLLNMLTTSRFVFLF